MSSGNGCESLFQCAIRSGGIDKQYIKPEQAEEGNDDQYDIGKSTLTFHAHSFFIFGDFFHSFFSPPSVFYLVKAEYDQAEHSCDNEQEYG